MNQLSFISSADSNWGIGCNNELLAYVKEDMQKFVDETMNGVIIAGRKTVSTFKDGKPLKNRVNIILTSDRNYSNEDAVIVHSVEEAIEKAKTYDLPTFVVGGESVFKQFLPYCDKAFITKFDLEMKADAYLPNLDILDGWQLSKETEWMTSKCGVKYKFCDYKGCK